MIKLYADYSDQFIHKTIVSKWKDGKRYSMKTESKSVSVANLISEKIGIRSKTVTRGKDGHCMLKKGSIHQEDKTMTKHMLIYTHYYV